MEEVLLDIRRMLEEGGVEGAATEAEWLLSSALGVTRSRLRLVEDMSERDEAAARLLAERRASGQPLQYVTGVAGFRRIEVSVGPGVFIPRPETELVAERAMSLLPQGGTIVDVGTGSGVIALSISDERPDARIYATEAATEALGWVRRNAKKLGASISILEGDLMAPLPASLREQIDVVVSNPPYVAWSHRHRLPRDVVEHEPHEALFAGERGRTVIGRLAGEALDWLRPEGWLVFEIDEEQGPEVRAILESRGYSDVAIAPDLNGRDRIAEGRR